MAEVTISNLHKSFDTVQAVNGVDLVIEDGELVTFLGPSGCGKTTTLRIIGGLEEADQGEVSIAGKVVNHEPPWKRDCGFVFQNYALFPHLTVFDNIAYGLKLRKKSNSVIKNQVRETASLLDIDHLLKRYPRELSGGQQQRVAVARALAIKPKVLLMDEPLTGLDAKLREKVRFELKNLQRQTGITTIYVTHDQEEAFALADKVVVMDSGRISHMGDPTEVYFEPRTAFVAEFIGSNNVFEGTVRNVGRDAVQVDIEGATLLGQLKSSALVSGAPASVMIRTTDVTIQAEPTDSDNELEGEVVGETFVGASVRINVSVGNSLWKVDVPVNERKKDLKPGQRTWLRVDPEHVRCFER